MAGTFRPLLRGEAALELLLLVLLCSCGCLHVSSFAVVGARWWYSRPALSRGSGSEERRGHAVKWAGMVAPPRSPVGADDGGRRRSDIRMGAEARPIASDSGFRMLRMPGGKKRGVDLRSDTVTEPTPHMRKVMSKAEVGDDVFGEDPTVNKLQEEVAGLLGKEAALFVPSGTMANLIANLVWCNQRGSEMICGDLSHCYMWESANAAQFGGIAYRPIPNQEDGSILLKDIRAAVRSNNVHFPTTRLVSLENSHNQCGGRVLSGAYVDSVGEFCHEAGLRLHMDGARLWNAAAALGEDPARLVQSCDSITVSFSKGLGAPVGSCIVGSADFIARARRARKALGGGMRQSGVLAAAASEGLSKMLPRIGEDHTNARKLARGIHRLGMPGGLQVRPETVETNIVLVTVGPDLEALGMDAEDFVEQLAQKDIFCCALDPTTVRFVTHYQISTSDIFRAISAVRDVLEEAGLTPSEAPVAPPAAPPPAAPAASVAPAPAAAAVATPGEGDVSAGVVVAAAPIESEAATAAKGASADDSEPVMTTAETRGSAASGGGESVWSSSPDDHISSSSTQYQHGEECPVSVTTADLDTYEEVCVRGMSVTERGFVAILESTGSGRALRVLITPEDPMSSGLDVNEPGTPEAVTLLQLLQGIDVRSHLPERFLQMKMECEEPVRLKEVYIHQLYSSHGPLKATLVGEEEHTEEEQSADGGVFGGEGFSATDDVGPCRPELQCEVQSGFEVIAMILRYGCTKVYVKPELLYEKTDVDGPASCFDALSIPKRYPNLMGFEAKKGAQHGDLAAAAAAAAIDQAARMKQDLLTEEEEEVEMVEDEEAENAVEPLNAADVAQLLENFEAAMIEGDDERASGIRGMLATAPESERERIEEGLNSRMR